jgi:hypothetical protein
MRLWVLAVLGCVGCAGSATPSVTSVPSAAATSAPVDDERRPYAELTQPAEADALKSPGIWVQVRDVAQLSGKLPKSLQTGAPGRMVSEIVQTVSSTLGADVGAVVDLSQPVDVAVSIPRGLGPPHPVFGFRVRSPEAIERGQAGLTLRRLSAGVWQLGDVIQAAPAPEPDDSELDDDETAMDEEEEEGEEPEPEPDERVPCLLAHAPAPVGYRVLCGPDGDMLRDLVGFMLRDTVVTQADVHVELSGPIYQERLQAALGEAIASGKAEAETNTGGEKLGAKMGIAIVEAFAAHERISFDVQFAPTGVDLLMDLAFPRSLATAPLELWTRSMATRRLPKSFALLPADHGLALAFTGLGQDATKAAMSAFWDELLGGMAQEYVLKPQELAEMNAAFTGLVPSDAHFSFAAGVDAAAASAVLSGQKVAQADATDRPLTPAAIKELQASLAGWMVVGLDVPPKDYLPAVERMLRANAIPMRRRPNMPRKDSDREDSKLRRRPLKTAGLPVGTLHLVDEVRPAKTYRAPLDGSEPPILPHDSHMLVVPDGQRVWLVSARDEALAGQRALAIVRGGATLAARPDIQQAVERPLIGAWSFTAGGMILQGLNWDSADERRLARIKLRRFKKQVDGMNTPMLATLELTPPPANDAPGFGFRVKLLVSDTTLGEWLGTMPPPIPVSPP